LFLLFSKQLSRHVFWLFPAAMCGWWVMMQAT